MAEPSEDRERRACRWLLVVAALAFVALRAPFLSLPLERDEGEYAYIAWRMLEGEVPYRDAFDQKPPGAFVAYLAAFAVAGTSSEAIHAMLLVWSAATAWLLYRVVRRLAGRLAAAFAVLVFAAIGADPSLGATAANTEALLLLPMLGSLLALLRALEDDAWRWWILCGALAAAACWFKQVAATHALFVVAVALLAPASAAGGRCADALRRLGGVALGGLAVSLPVFAAFAAAGAFEPFLDAVFLHNLEYARRRSASQGLDNLLWSLARQAPSLALVWALALGALLWPGAGRAARPLLGGWLAFSALGVAVGLQFRPHYFVQAVPALAALAGLCLAALARRALPAGRPAFSAVAAALALLVVAPPVVAHRDLLLAESPEAASRVLYGLNPFPEAPEIARYIASTSEPGDSVYVVGSEPQILFHAGRRSATRYIFFYPLTEGTPRASQRQREAIEEVRRSRPRYVVWVHVATSLLVSEDTDPWIFEASQELLGRDYRLELVVRPNAALEGYEFVHGSDALRWARQQGEALDSLPWIAVYRRVH